MQTDFPNQAIIAAFLSSMDLTMNKYDHVRNATMDAKLYEWNSSTLGAILAGIRNAYEEKVR